MVLMVRDLIGEKVICLIIGCMEMVDAGIQLEYRWSNWFMESDWLMIRC